jgi:hypothetical protein
MSGAGETAPVPYDLHGSGETDEVWAQPIELLMPRQIDTQTTAATGQVFESPASLGS